MALLRSRNVATASATTAITVTTPAVVAGDMLFFVIAGDGANSITQTTPAGWTSPGGGNVSLGDHVDTYVYYRVATGGEAASYTFTANGPNQHLCAQILAFIGPVTFERVATNIIPASSASAPPTAWASPATTANNITDFVLQVLASTSTATGSTPVSSAIATSWASPAGYTDGGTTVNGTALSLDVQFGAAGALAVASATFTANTGTDGQFVTMVFTDTSQTVRPTGLFGTGTLGSFSILNGSNNSVNVIGLHGTMALGSIGNEVDYSNTFVGGTPPFNTVYVQSPIVYGRGQVHKDVSAGVIDPIPEGFPAFQPNAFQTDAFQTIAYVHSGAVQATGAVGSVIYQASYFPVLPMAWSMSGQLGTLLEYHVDYPITGVYGTGAIGVVDVPLLVYVSGLTATTHLGTVAVHFDCIFALPGGIYYLRPMVGHLGAPSVTYDKIFSVTGLYATGAVGSITPTSLYAVTGVVGTMALGAVDPQVLYRVLGVAGTGLLGHFVAGWVQAVPVSGVSGSAALNPPTVVNPNTFGSMSVQGTGGVGQVGFQISGSAAIVGVVGLGYVGAVHIAVDSSVDAIGLAAAGVLGNVTALGMPRLQVNGSGQVGAVGIRVDCAVQIFGLGAVGHVGAAGEQRSSEAHVTGVQATGSIGSAAAAPVSAYDKGSFIYVRTQ